MPDWNVTEVAPLSVTKLSHIVLKWLHHLEAVVVVAVDPLSFLPAARTIPVPTFDTSPTAVSIRDTGVAGGSGVSGVREHEGAAVLVAKHIS